MELIEEIKNYISLLQARLVNEIGKTFQDLWDYEGGIVQGWECNPHGEHICSYEISSGLQIEIPLLSKTHKGIDVGHFNFIGIQQN